MQRILNIETVKYLSKKVKVCGWVKTIRSHGKIIFIDLRDRSGLLQLVFTPEVKEDKSSSPTALRLLNKDLYKKCQKLRPEWVIGVEGEIKERPKKMINPKLETGRIELKPKKLEIFSQAKTLPFPVDTSGYEISEEKRLKYRYLDLRRDRIRKNLEIRQKVIQFMRTFLQKEGFIEIETPILTRSTPEGARDFLVPSRLQSGKFYALPQSPQQYKQLLMVGGIEQYFQIAKCLRDEDPRADRQFEHTQLDVEMSFVEQEEILNLIEELYINLIQILTPKKKITKIPFPRLTYEEVIKKYGTDRPDLRKNKKDQNEVAFCWVIDWPLFEWNKEEKRYDPMHHIFTAPKEKDVGSLDKEPLKVHSWQHDLVFNGHEIGGGSIRINNKELQEKVFKLVGINKIEAQKKFGHLLRAFEYGAPPEGGIALGIDRLVMLLSGEENIREVIAFPKTGDGRDPMMDMPAEVTEKQLKELHIKIIKPKGR